MKYKEYIQLKQQLEEKLKAVETVWQMSQESGIGDQPFRKGEISKTVRNAVTESKGSFNVKKIEEMIKAENPNSVIKRQSISLVLKRLERDGMIEAIEVGQGRRATVYRSKKPAEL